MGLIGRAPFRIWTFCAPARHAKPAQMISLSGAAGSGASGWELPHMADVCALGRLVTRVCAMTFAVVGVFTYDTPLARMSAGR
jgi:hypothetical protein